MSSIYDRTDIYDLLEDQTHWSAYKKHWKTLLQGKNVHSFLDVSIGSGSVTLPLCELGVQLAGSDLSEEMIRKCKEKASAAGYEIELRVVILGIFLAGKANNLTVLPVREIHCRM